MKIVFIGCVKFSLDTLKNLVLNGYEVLGVYTLKNSTFNSDFVDLTPYCKKNLDYTIKQSKKFLEGKSPPDFAPEDYEINYKGRIKIGDLSLLAKKQLALEEWN